jgi:hypothetical protein
MFFATLSPMSVVQAIGSQWYTRLCARKNSIDFQAFFGLFSRCLLAGTR